MPKHLSRPFLSGCRWLCACVLVCLVGAGVRAQNQTAVPVDAPLILWMNGADIWASQPAGAYPYALTGGGYNDRPVLSPDGTRLAYRAVADIGIAALRRTGGLVSELPSDVYVRDLTTGAVVQAAGQPEGATFNAGEPARAALRSAPAWSPDGTRLVWTQALAPDDVRQLVVYDVASATPTVLASDLPLQSGFTQSLPVRWGGQGIALKSVTETAPSAPAPDGVAQSRTQVETILIYDEAGALRTAVTLDAGAGEFVYAFVWIDVRGVEQVGVVYSSGRWATVDPFSGGVAPLAAAPELYSLSAPDGIAVVFGVTTLPDLGAVFTWTVRLPNETAQPLAYTGPLDWITISPAGDALAYSAQGVAYVWRGGAAEPLVGTNATNLSAADLAWGATGWRVR